MLVRRGAVLRAAVLALLDLVGVNLSALVGGIEKEELIRVLV